MEKFYLQVNIVNIITITLMWMIGFAVFGFLSAAVRGNMGDE
jgi:TM2 domain-containing membrane protein YozV